VSFDDVPQRLPEQLSRPSGRTAVADVAGIPPVAFRLPDGRAWRWRADAGTIRVERTDDAPLMATLDEAAWDDLVAERSTIAGLRYAGRIALARGAFDALERWEPALRALFSDRPLVDPARGPAAAARDLPLEQLPRRVRAGA
jgi:hypothetical protein